MPADRRQNSQQQANKPNRGADQRIFSSSIRSALGGKASNLAGRRIRDKPCEPKSSYQNIDEALKELGRALEQPSTSLDDFEAFIRQNAERFGEQECQEVATKLCKYVIQSGEFRFLLKICWDNIRHLNLMDALAQEILLAANEYFLSGDTEQQSVPELFGHIVAAKWPPGKGKALENVNPILYVGINIVMSWITIMNSYGKPKSPDASTPVDPETEQIVEPPITPDAEPENLNTSNKNEPENDGPTSLADKNPEGRNSDDRSNENNREHEEAEYDEKVASLAALSICTVCNIAQRNFWLTFMETFDDVFMATKHLLTSPEAHLPKRVKESLLQLYISLFKWSATKQAKCTSVYTQTQ